MNCSHDSLECRSDLPIGNGPIPTWMIIVVTSCGFIGLVCVALYTNYITSGRHSNAPVQERYFLGGEITGTMIKEKSKHVVELLLRGGNLAALPTTRKSLQTSTMQGESAFSVDEESHI